MNSPLILKDSDIPLKQIYQRVIERVSYHNISP